LLTCPARASISTVNADETLLAGTYIEGEGTDYNNQRPATAAANSNNNATRGHPLDQPKSKGQMMEDRWAARLPMGLFFVSVNTGEVKTIHRANDWLNHLLFSPTDPTLLMFCHEGPWHKVDRIWLMRTDGSHGAHTFKQYSVSTQAKDCTFLYDRTLGAHAWRD